ncbi:MAG TPA: hypothetical protein VGE82_03100 [Nitrososphaera sp.]
MLGTNTPDEYKDQIIKQIMQCNYYPKDITVEGMKEYMEKEETNEPISPDDVIIQSIYSLKKGYNYQEYGKAHQ